MISSNILIILVILPENLALMLMQKDHLSPDFFDYRQRYFKFVEIAKKP